MTNNKIKNELILKFNQTPTQSEVDLIIVELEIDYNISKGGITSQIIGNYVLLRLLDFTFEGGDEIDGIVAPARAPIGPKGPKVDFLFNIRFMNLQVPDLLTFLTEN